MIPSLIARRQHDLDPLRSGLPHRCRNAVILAQRERDVDGVDPQRRGLPDCGRDRRRIILARRADIRRASFRIIDANGYDPDIAPSGAGEDRRDHRAMIITRMKWRPRRVRRHVIFRDQQRCEFGGHRNTAIDDRHGRPFNRQRRRGPANVRCDQQQCPECQEAPQPKRKRNN